MFQSVPINRLLGITLIENIMGSRVHGNGVFTDHIPFLHSCAAQMIQKRAFSFSCFDLISELDFYPCEVFNSLIGECFIDIIQ